MNAENTALPNPGSTPSATSGQRALDTRPPMRAGLRARLTDLLSDAAVYGASSMLGQVIGLLLLPLYTDYLGTRQYGVLAMLAIITMLFGPVANLGMTNAIFRRYNQCENDAARRNVLGTGLASVVASSLVLLAASLLAAGPIANLVVGDPTTTGLVRLCLLSASIAAIGAVPRIILRAGRRVRVAAALNLVQVVASVLPTVWLVVAGEGVRGVVLGTLIGEVVTAAAAFYCTWGSFQVGLDLPTWRPMLSYGLPFVPHHVQAVGLALFGQYMVGKMISLDEAGLYNIALKFALPVSFVVSSVQTSWVAYKFQITAEDHDPTPFFRSTLTYYVAGLSYLWVGVSLWGPEMVRLMTQPDFHAAALLVWAVGLIPLAQGLYFMLGTGIEVGDNTRQYPLVSLAGLIAVVAGAFLLVPTAGPYGAAMATALGWLIMSIVIYVLSQRRYPIAYDWPTLASLAASAAAMVAMGQMAQSQPLGIRLLIAAALSLAFPVVAFALLCRSRDERERMLSIGRRLSAVGREKTGASISPQSNNQASAAVSATNGSPRESLRSMLRAGYRMVRGGGEPSLLRRKDYHARRQVAERAVLAEARSNQGMFHTVACPACDQSEASDTFQNPVGFSFARCAHDGTVYMNPAPSGPTLGRLYNDESYATFWSVGHSADPADYARVVDAVGDRQGLALLDVGCATGQFLKLARERFECHGVEITAETAEHARQAGFPVVTGTLADVPGSERFDVITMLQVIEHLVDAAGELAHVHRLLKHGGLFYLNTPCVDSASFALFRQRHMHVSSFGHVSLFTRQGLDCLARRCGFAMIGHGYCGGSDIRLDDLVAHKLAPRRFRHRVALYSPRFLNACTFVDKVTGGRLTAALSPRGNESYQWAVFQKP